MQDGLDTLASYLRVGRFEEAIALGRSLCAEHSSSAAVHSALAAAYAQAGRAREAEQSYALAAGLDGSNANVLNEWGVTLAILGRRDEALDRFTRAVQTAPDFAGARYNLGLALADMGRGQEAIEQFRATTRLDPQGADAFNNLGSLLAEQNQFEEAIECYRRVLALDANFVYAHNNLGTSLLRVGKPVQAAESFKRAISLAPNFAEAYSNLGLALTQTGDIEQAISAYTRALQIKPALAEAHYNLANAYAEHRQPELALKSLDRALELKPGHTGALTQKLHQLALMCDWRQADVLEPLIAGLGIEGDATGPFPLLSMEDNPGRHRIRAERYARKEFPCVAAPVWTPSVRTKLRIGYFSADFHHHPSMRLMARFFELHDRGRFETHAFSYALNRDDDMRARLKHAFDQFHEVHHLDDKAIADFARQQGIDVAIDLTGYTLHTRTQIFAHRPAPVQINYLGYPGTMGTAFFDYIIADGVVIPEGGEAFYSEKIIRMPHTYYITDDTAAVGDASARADAGLPEDGVVFCCFNNCYKISPREFDIWMRLLRRVEGSVLWLLKTNSFAMENLRREAVARGVAPERIVFAEYASAAEHLARHRLADLFLDTFIYNAHTTASDALWAGLPVVTKIGSGFTARVAASLLTAVGVPELITTTDDGYEALAFAFATNPTKLAAVKSKLRDARATAPLFDTALSVRCFEQAYETAYRLHAAGEAPKAFDVTA